MGLFTCLNAVLDGDSVNPQGRRVFNVALEIHESVQAAFVPSDKR